MIQPILNLIVGCLVCTLATNAPAQSSDSRASWTAGNGKREIVTFVRRVTDPNSPDFVTPADRIAVFDNDGTLWVEQPMYTQLAFAIDRIKALASEHPEWKTQQPFQAVLDNDLPALAASGKRGLLELLMASHAGMSTAEFEQVVTDWFATARHPRLKRPYTELTYQPMVELLDYLRDHGFKTFIVSGGGVEFMRPMTQAAYGIPPEQVIGSSIKVQYETKAGQPQLTRLPEIDFIDDKSGNQ
jgi:phosphoglycolate phosphatase-like HAD superfamily hydrolase